MRTSTASRAAAPVRARRPWHAHAGCRVSRRRKGPQEEDRDESRCRDARDASGERGGAEALYRGLVGALRAVRAPDRRSSRPHRRIVLRRRPRVVRALLRLDCAPTTSSSPPRHRPSWSAPEPRVVSPAYAPRVLRHVRGRVRRRQRIASCAPPRRVTRSTNAGFGPARVRGHFANGHTTYRAPVRRRSAGGGSRFPARCTIRRR